MQHTWKTVTAAASVCLGFACLAVFMRTWNRARIMTCKLRSDDWWILVALLLYALMCGAMCGLAAIEHKHPIMDHHAADILLLIMEVAEVFFLLVSVTLKFSLSIFFRRFLIESWQRKIVWHSTVIYGAVSTIATVIVIFQCGLPVNLASKQIGQKCFPRTAFKALLYVHGSFATLTDWIFAILPISIIYKSQMRTAEKVSASALLSLAVCGSIVAILRTVTSVGIVFGSEYLDPTYRPTFYWHLNIALELAIIEMGLGITAVSLACCRHMFRHAASQWRSLVSSCSSAIETPGDTPAQDIEKAPRLRVDSVRPRSAVGKCGILPTVPEYTIPQHTVDRAEELFQGKLGVLPTVPGDTVDLIAMMPPR